jgi:hypothetical protein
MIDHEAIVRTHLLTNTALVTLVSTRIYAGTHLPDGYTPADGPAVVFATRGGNDAYSRATTVPSMQYRCFGATPTIARQVDRALYDALQDEAGVSVRTSIRDTYPQLLQDPETDWWYVFSGYRHWLVVS